jgi:hypothetical protein
MSKSTATKRPKSSSSKKAKSTARNTSAKSGSVSVKKSSARKGTSSRKASGRTSERKLVTPPRGPSRFTIKEAMETFRTIEAQRA